MTRLVCCLLAALLLLLSGCSRQRTYEVKGRIVGFGDDDRTVLIEHENIPGLMPAMTMPFRTRPGVDLHAFQTQDAIGFRLVLTADSSWIEDLVRLPDSLVAAHPAGQPDAAYETTGTPSILSVGDAVPADTLIDQHGRPFTLQDYQGQAVVLTFIYTRCPLPEFCPRLSTQFQALQPQLAERYGDAVHLLSISFDPQDTPDVLRDYARRYTNSTDTWTFATGSEETIREMATAFGVYYEAADQDFNHNLATALVTPDGRVRRIWRGTEWTPDTVLQAIENMMPTEAASP